MKQQKYIDEIKIFFSRTSGLISRRLGTKHPWVKRIQVCSNEGPSPFPNFNKTGHKRHSWVNVLGFFCGFTREFCTHMEMYFGEEDFSIKHTCVKEVQLCSLEGPSPFTRRDNNEIAKIH